MCFLGFEISSPLGQTDSGPPSLHCQALWGREFSLAASKSKSAKQKRWYFIRRRYNMKRGRGQELLKSDTLARYDSVWSQLDRVAPGWSFKYYSGGGGTGVLVRVQREAGCFQLAGPIHRHTLGLAGCHCCTGTFWAISISAPLMLRFNISLMTNSFLAKQTTASKKWRPAVVEMIHIAAFLCYKRLNISCGPVSNGCFHCRLICQQFQPLKRQINQECVFIAVTWFPNVLKF